MQRVLDRGGSIWKRLHPNVLAIALANKLARIACAMLARDASSSEEDQ